MLQRKDSTEKYKENQMKNSKKMFILTEAVLAGLVIIVAFATFQERIGEERGKISVIIRNSDDNQWAAFKYGLRMAAQDYQMEVSVVSTGGTLSIEEEKEAIENEIDHGADAVIVQPVPGNDTENILKRLRNRVPIILVESLTEEVEQATGLPAVTPDNLEIGKALAAELLKDYSGRLKGKTMGIIFGDGGAASERMKGFALALKDEGARVIWTVSGLSFEEEENTLERQEKVDFVIALDDDSLTKAGKAASANDLHGALVYGIGNSTEAVYYLDTGFARCLVVPDEFNVGYQSVKEAAESFGRFLRKPREKTVSFTVLRRDTLFLKENQEILFTMSQ